MSRVDPAILAVLLVCFVLILGALVHFVLEQRLDRKITTLHRGDVFRFECTCGWHGCMRFVHRPVSMKCPRCNGIAVQINYRGSEE